jgi:hypothetical protein
VATAWQDKPPACSAAPAKAAASPPIVRFMSFFPEERVPVAKSGTGGLGGHGHVERIGR